MKHQLPPDAQAQFDETLKRLLSLLATAREQTGARSVFMNYDGDTGGQVLESTPPIEHSHKELSDLYLELFERAKRDKLQLREIETLFERTSSSAPWTHRTRWLQVDEFKVFAKRITPLSKEIGVALRELGAHTAPDWYKAVFDFVPGKPRLLVLHGKKIRAVQEPPPNLIQQAQRIADAAREDSLELTGASWTVRNDDDDDAGDDVDAAVGVMPAWPDSK